jgi:hypothetical protein
MSYVDLETLWDNSQGYTRYDRSKEDFTSKSPQGSTADMVKDRQTRIGTAGGLASLWLSLWAKGIHNSKQHTHVTSYPVCLIQHSTLNRHVYLGYTR